MCACFRDGSVNPSHVSENKSRSVKCSSYIGFHSSWFMLFYWLTAFWNSLWGSPWCQTEGEDVWRCWRFTNSRTCLFLVLKCFRGVQRTLSHFSNQKSESHVFKHSEPLLLQTHPKIRMFTVQVLWVNPRKWIITNRKLEDFWAKSLFLLSKTKVCRIIIV